MSQVEISKGEVLYLAFFIVPIRKSKTLQFDCKNLFLIFGETQIFILHLYLRGKIFGANQFLKKFTSFVIELMKKRRAIR